MVSISTASPSLLRVLPCVVAVAQLAETASSFDGTWNRERRYTTPRGVHVVANRTLDIHASGTSTELSRLTLTQTISGVTKTLQIVQRAKAMKSEVKAGVLTIQWSELQLLSPPRSEIPPGLHLWTAPRTFTYTLRGKELFETSDKSMEPFHRVKS